MPFLKNAWYMAGWSHEFTVAALIPRTVVGEPVVFFRKSDGTIAALADTCPHRLAPLHLGALNQDRVRCGYHGLEFDASGACVHNPHGNGAIPSAARVAAFPVHERNLIAWIWMGEPEKADAALLPDYSFLSDAPETARNTGYLPTKANYQLLSDNILDLSHADFLHTDTLGGGSLTRSRAKIAEEGDTVRIRWEVSGDIVPPVFARELADPTARLDQWTQVIWTAPATMHLSLGVVDPEHSNLVVDALHIMTPETDTTTHYFFASRRHFKQDDVEYNRMAGEMTRNIFSHEDKPVIEAQQLRMGAVTDLLSLNPMLLPIDSGALRARRKLSALIEGESAGG